MNKNNSNLVVEQSKQYNAQWTDGSNRYSMIAAVRHDDRCGNGHNTFSITADIRENGREYAGGCCHEEIAKRIPELAPFIKWHLTRTDGPMHYVVNTVYQAGDRDCWGMRKGEFEQHTSRTGEGKERDFKAARECAVWPDATDAELSVEPEELKAALVARLPKLLEEFQSEVEGLGLKY